MKTPMTAIEMTGMVDKNHQLKLDGVLPFAGPKRVRVIVLAAPDDDIDEATWLYAESQNPAFSFLAAFFIGGYFYEIEPELANNPVILWICQLGGGKGKITRHYFLEGLKNLLIHQQVEHFREEARLKSDEWSDIMEFAL